jgi:group I intron endonuclease
MFVYVIVNVVNCKIYVGKTKENNLQHYWSRQKDSILKGDAGKPHLYNAVRKYGWDNFTIYPLVTDCANNEALCVWEQALIKIFLARDPEIGYNICKGGEGHTAPHSEESRLKIIENTRLMWQRPGHKERFSAKMMGHLTSEETIDKIKAARAVQDETPRVAGCRKYAEEHPEEMSTRMSREVHSLGGKSHSRETLQRAGRIAARSLPKAHHTRWHLNRGIKKPGCSFCELSLSL